MKRQIIQIDEKLCNGCGACAAACQEGAIAMVDGKARLLRDDYCDGLGNCLPACPTGAITFVEREAEPYDKAAAAAKSRAGAQEPPVRGGCPGSRTRVFAPRAPREEDAPAASELRQWPVQIRLAPLAAPFYDGADLLVAADCAAYACGSFHRDYMRGRITLIGCPKLDPVDYSEKLTEIIRRNDVRSVTVVRMEVPCCGGLEQAVIAALKASGKFIPWQVVTLATDGRVLS